MKLKLPNLNINGLYTAYFLTIQQQIHLFYKFSVQLFQNVLISNFQGLVYRADAKKGTDPHVPTIIISDRYLLAEPTYFVREYIYYKRTNYTYKISKYWKNLKYWKRLFKQIINAQTI